MAILDSAARSGVGISTFVSLGNKIDVSTNDLLSYWYDDLTTQAVALYVESFGNPRRFTWLARALSTRKPILAVKSGRSTAGRRAGTSHTAAAAAPDVAVDTLFRQAGVLRMDTLGELLDAARLLTEQPLPAGDRVVIVGNAGGLNILAADAAEAAGLQVVELSASLQQQFADVAPHLAGVANPVDLGADAPPATIGRAVRALGSSGEADALVVTLVATCTNDLPGAVAALAEAADDQPHLPIVAVVVGGDSPLKLGRRDLPVYELPEDAVRSLGHACWYARWRREPTGSKPVIPGIDRRAAQRIVAAALTDGAGWQPVEISHRLMACYGVPLQETRLATSIESAEKAARELGPDCHEGDSSRTCTQGGAGRRPARTLERVGRTPGVPGHRRLARRSKAKGSRCNRWCQPVSSSSLAWRMMPSSAHSSWWAWAVCIPTCSGIDHFERCR